MLDRYVYIENFLDKDKCQNLINRFNTLISAGAAVRDSQCPQSLALYGIFDDLLSDKLVECEKISEKKLLPTYSYARMYVPGETLPIHLDRSACEISLTLTLGFDGDVWPFYIGDINKENAKKFEIAAGDALAYLGTKVFHWRDVYTQGKRQAQVFLHYVDANGEQTDWVYDKRPSLYLPNKGLGQ